MDTSYSEHPRRFPKNAPGPFYTLGYRYPPTAENATPKWCGDCLQCEAPEREAPQLLAPLNDSNTDTYFVRQPESAEEIADACLALQVCCVDALRYGGKDRDIIQRLGNKPELCDYIIAENGELLPALDSSGNYLPFAQQIVDQRQAEWERRKERRAKQAKWWQFWKRAVTD